MRPEIADLLQISHFYGPNKEFIIAGGGNASFKEKDNMFIKASGVALSTITEDGLVQLNRTKITTTLEKTYSKDPVVREDQVKEDLLTSRVFPEKGTRPSVESALHHMIDYLFVVHTHPTIINSVLSSVTAKETAFQLFGLKPLFIEYTDPGYTLAKKVAERLHEYRQIYGQHPNTILLENHGVFVGANSVNEIQMIYNEMTQTVQKKIKNLVTRKELPLHPNTNNVVKALRQVLSNQAESLVCKIRFTNLVSKFYNSVKAFAPIKFALSPDIVVYCRGAPVFFADYKSDDPVTVIEQKIRNHLNSFQKVWGYIPKIMVIPQIGAVGIDRSDVAVEIVLDMFEDWMKLSLYSQNFGGPKFLTRREIDFIDKWEVEKYRRGVAGTR